LLDGVSSMEPLAVEVLQVLLERVPSAVARVLA
jgi:hypothetical protein